MDNNATRTLNNINTNTDIWSTLKLLGSSDMEKVINTIKTIFYKESFSFIDKGNRYNKFNMITDLETATFRENKLQIFIEKSILFL